MENEILINTYPEGWEKVKESLDFVPEEEREGFLFGLMSTIYQY